MNDINLCQIKEYIKVTRRRVFGGNSPLQIRTRRGALIGSKRWIFIQSGVTHPRFIELIQAVTTSSQQERISLALESLFGEE